MTVPAPLVRVQHLRVGYGTGNAEHVLFSGLHFTLDAGTLVCLMGPNGIGKSTLLRTIAGLHPALAGVIQVCGRAIREPDPTRIAVVLTERIASTNLRCRDLVGFGRYPSLGWSASYRNGDERIIEKSLQRVHLLELADRPVDELSDGQLQMALIARALAQETPVLLLDEPSAHLDLNNRLEIMKLLKFLAREEGKSILISTHELDLALQMADKILLAGRDQSLRTGIPEDLVLNGSFDDIFRLKGFDLKTGRITQDLSGGRTVCLEGDGHALLWTRNALERTGISVSPEASDKIIVVREGERIRWRLQATESNDFESLERLLAALTSSWRTAGH